MLESVTKPLTSVTAAPAPATAPSASPREGVMFI
jgi:hypothetical protein